MKVLANGVEVPGDTVRLCTHGVCMTTRSALLNDVTYTAGQTFTLACSVNINQPSFTCSAAKTASVQRACIGALKTETQSSTASVSSKFFLTHSALLGLAYGTQMLKTGLIASYKTPGFWQLGCSNILEMIAKTINHRVTELIQSPKRIAHRNRGRKFAKIS